KEELIIAVNAGTSSAKANVNVASLNTQPNKLLYGTAEVEWNGKGETQQLTLSVPARSGCILGVGSGGVGD
ncbi:alpha-amylase, partial [Nostoc sp. HG1]|nr:alpha-amylase [Nostoc sp. HG1]